MLHLYYLQMYLISPTWCDFKYSSLKVLSVLKHSLLSFKQPKTMEMLKLYFLFSLQFLVKEV